MKTDMAKRFLNFIEADANAAMVVQLMKSDIKLPSDSVVDELIFDVEPASLVVLENQEVEAAGTVYVTVRYGSGSRAIHDYPQFPVLLHGKPRADGGFDVTSDMKTSGLVVE